MSGPLRGIRVVDLGIMAAGPATGAFLAQLGAEVVKVEPPAGDGTRWAHPTQNGMGTNFLAMNLGKKDVVLDLKTAEGRSAALTLIRSADVLLQNMATGVAERLGMGYDDLRPQNPRLVYCAISGYGRVGPLARDKGHDQALQAISAFARLNGRAGDDLEHFRFTGLIDLVTAAVATNSIVAGLLDRVRTGEGQNISVSMLEASLEVQFRNFNQFLADRVHPLPNGSASGVSVPDRAYRASDGEIFLTVRDNEEWLRLCSAIGNESLSRDERLRSREGRLALRHRVDEAVQSALAGQPAAYWLRVLAKAGVPAGKAWSIHDIEFNVQAIENAMVSRIDTFAGPLTVGGVPWHFSRTPAAVQPPPKPDQHTGDLDIIAGRWAGRERSPVSIEPGASDATLLDGCKVVELASGDAGALACLRLQDLGAEVIRVEFGDDAGPDRFLDRGKTLLHVANFPDLEAELDRLIAGADIVVLANRRRFWEAIECVGSRRLQTREGQTPRLWVDITDFGPLGPLAGHEGSELVIQAFAG